jgi:hypothetical protein
MFYKMFYPSEKTQPSRLGGKGCNDPPGVYSTTEEPEITGDRYPPGSQSPAAKEKCKPDTTQCPLTPEQRDRMEKNRLCALERRRSHSSPKKNLVDAFKATSSGSDVAKVTPSLTPEQRRRMEDNRKRALDRRAALETKQKVLKPAQGHVRNRFECQYQRGKTTGFCSRSYCVEDDVGGPDEKDPNPSQVTSSASACMEVTTDKDMPTAMTQVEDLPSSASSKIQTASKKRDACELDPASDDNTNSNVKQRTMLNPTPTAERLVSPPMSRNQVPVEQVCMKTGRVLLQFPSPSETAISVDGVREGISRVVNREKKSYMGYSWWRQRRVHSDASAHKEVTADKDMPPTKTQMGPSSSTSNKIQKTSKKMDADELDPEDDGRKPDARCDKTDHQEMYDDETDHQEMYYDDEDDDDTDQKIYDETEDQERLASPPPKVASVSLATAYVMASAGFICGACIMFAAIIILV